jgi:hypothetical protein
MKEILENQFISQLKNKGKCFSQSQHMSLASVFRKKRMFQALVCKTEVRAVYDLTGNRGASFISYSLINH